MSDAAYNLMAAFGGAVVMYGWYLSRKFLWPLYLPVITFGVILFLLSVYQPLGITTYP